MELKPGDPVVIIYNQGRSNEWIAITCVHNIGKQFITVRDFPDRFRIDTMHHKHTHGYGYDVIVHRDSEEGKQAVTRERLRTIESQAAQKCYEFYRNRCKQNRQAALDALKDCDDVMNEIDK